jgi:type IV pilus assembly protein PilW
MSNRYLPTVGRLLGAVVPSPLRHQTGMTLLELMISMSLGLLLVAGIGAVYVGSNQTYRVQEDNARIQENGRYALEVIGRSLRQAGFADIPVSSTSTKTSFTGTAISGLNTVCPTAAPLTDVITVQYDGMVGELDCQGGAVTPGQFVQHTFFVQNDGTNTGLRCNATRNTAAPTPPTACPANGTGVELVSNVEDLQILYGIDTDADQSADRYVVAPSAAQQPLVVSARVCALIRSDNTGISGAAQRYVNCIGALDLDTSTGLSPFTTATDTRLRRAFVATFNLRNRVLRLP